MRILFVSEITYGRWLVLNREVNPEALKSETEEGKGSFWVGRTPVSVHAISVLSKWKHCNQNYQPLLFYFWIWAVPSGHVSPSCYAW